jgi:hypothetical protein
MMKCGAHTRTFMGYCDRPVPQLGDRCWQHRRRSANEVTALQAAAKKARMAKFAQDERRAELTLARSVFLTAALAHGLDHKVTRGAFQVFRETALFPPPKEQP